LSRRHAAAFDGEVVTVENLDRLVEDVRPCQA
jgi:hypothetical protein